MLLSDLVGFKSELFFDGAVQLRWVDEKPEKAADAAENFVFHGPSYHGVGQEDADVISSAYKLKDTASLVLELLESFVPDPSRPDPNPLSLAVAGYGSGKSHFALTVAKLLMSPNELLACKIIHSITSADVAIGERVELLLEQIGKPSLVVTLDGMSNFHLGSELSRGIIKQLKVNGLDLGPILELSPRFTYAGDFVKRNFEIRKDDFAKYLEGFDKDTICGKLQENDENTYEIVDEIFYLANGTRIPVDGQESAQDLINTVCESYCGEGGHFSNLIILFDEFGRYLEYAAEKPRLAGDSTLQQIFQGIQDNKKLVRFIGFIQYELKAYLNRFSHKELSQLQRYITRFDSANKLYLSTNLETLFAHLIEKKDPIKLKALIQSDNNRQTTSETHAVLCQNLPGINKLPVWRDGKLFQKVIVEGCWPLHPMTTWFLTRQQDIVQSRSALTFIKDVLDVSSCQQINPADSLYSIPPAELVLRSMLQEVVAAERAQGGIIAETLLTLLEKYQARLDDSQQLVLAGIMILDKLRISSRSKEQIDRLLLLATGLNARELTDALKYLSTDIGAVEWNRDLCQYELVADAATRGQFQQALKKKLSGLDQNKIGDLFISKAKFFGELGDIESDFAVSKEIYSRDWQFSAMHAQSTNYLDVVVRAFEEWKSAEDHDEAKGRVIYLYITAQEDPDAFIEKSKTLLNGLLSKHKISSAPIWTIIIHDKDEKIAENFSRLYVLEDKFQADELAKFSRFIPEEKERSSRTLLDEIQAALRQRLFAVAGINEIVNQRLKATANSIFEQIYPNALPFPFDGFQLKSGTGPKDCAQLIKALIGRQVSGNWISTQIPAFQNRFKRLFVQVWKVIGSTGNMQLKPGLKQLADLLDDLETTHSNQDLTLFDTYSKLLGPPFGYNSSSAGLIIGLLLARETPPRALKYKDENIAEQDWLGCAFPSKVGKHYIDKNCLKLTKIIFLSEDSLQRWQKTISEIDFELNLRKKIDLYNAAKKMIKSDPVPQILIGQFQFISATVAQAEIELSDHVKKVESIERELEQAERRSSIKHCIRYGAELKKLLKLMDEKETYWSTRDFDEVKGLILGAVSAINGKVPQWLELETCNSVQQVQDYRSKMDKAARDLTLLGLNAEAELVELHKNNIISQIEIRDRYQTSIKSAVDFVRQPAPTKRTTLWKLKEETKTCDTLIENLSLAHKQIGGADIANIISQVSVRKENIKVCIKQQRDELSQISNLPLQNLSDVKFILQKISEQANIFQGTNDEAYINDMLKQLNIIGSDMQAWHSIIMPPEDTEITLTEQIDRRCKELNDCSEDDEEDTVWTYNEVYTGFKNEIVKERYSQSDKWISTIKPDVNSIDHWSLQECEKQLSIISDRPKFLSRAHALEIESVENSIRSKVAEIKERDRQVAAAKWIETIKGQIESKDQLSIEDCERLLRSLEKMPDVVSEKEIHHVLALRKVLIERQDELDIKSIINRILSLRDELRVGLFNELRKLYKYE